MQEVTRLLNAIDGSDPAAAAELLPLVYEDLRRLAAVRMAEQPPGQTLQPTALVHEAWLRIAGEDHAWQNRRHFFAAAAEAMRRILVDQARRRQRQKRGGGAERIPIETLDVAAASEPDAVVRVHEAVTRLAAEDPVKAELVKLRFFVGLPISEAADVLGLSPTTAKRHWTFARAWLLDELRET